MTNYTALRAQFANNAIGLRALADRATRTGKPVHGKPAAYWQASANRYEVLSQATDLEIREHLQSARAGMAARLAQLQG